jgi:catechol 2,3-dioxygenase-like lactoylglutathione lyase family enzyme
MEIGHLHILVNDVAVSQQFYQQNFALSLLAEEEFGVILRDDSGIDFVIGPATDDQQQGQRMHLGFRLQSRAEVKAKFDELGARGQTFVMPYTENAFITLFSVFDPDGNLIEVYFAELD